MFRGKEHKGKRKYQCDSAIFHDTGNNNNGVLLLLTIIVKTTVIFPCQVERVIKFQNDKDITGMYEDDSRNYMRIGYENCCSWFFFLKLKS